MSKLGGLVLQQWKQRAIIWWPYIRTELRPPSPTELAEIPKGFQKLAASAKSGAYKNLTVRQAWLNTLVGIEIACWFFVGECIGKGTMIGYVIKPE